MDGFIPLAPRDYKGYVGYMAVEPNEKIDIYLHVPCGGLVGDKETHRRVCPEIAQ